MDVFRAFCGRFAKHGKGGMAFGKDVIFLLVVLAGAAYFDIREKRVPNWWNLGAFLCGLGLEISAAGGGSGLEGGPGAAAAAYMGRSLAAAAAGFPLFALRMIGAGDIKLAAVVFACQGVGDGLRTLGSGLAAGAVCAAVRLLAGRQLRLRMEILYAYVQRMFFTGEAVPYYVKQRDAQASVPLAACLFAGYLWTLFLQ